MRTGRWKKVGDGADDGAGDAAAETEEEITEEGLLRRAEELRRREEALEERIRQVAAREKTVVEAEGELREFQAQLESLRVQKLIELNEEEKDHLELMQFILYQHMQMVENQTRRRPESPMSLNQIRTINGILAEMKRILAGSGMDAFLQIAEEPEYDEEGRETRAGTMLTS